MEYMDRLNNIVFVDSLPKLDLHGYDRETARVAINDFICDHKIMGNDIVVIVHGRGQGILLKQTKETLKHNKDVVCFKQDNNNQGCTLVLIKE